MAERLDVGGLYNRVRSRVTAGRSRRRTASTSNRQPGSQPNYQPSSQPNYKPTRASTEPVRGDETDVTPERGRETPLNRSQPVQRADRTGSRGWRGRVADATRRVQAKTKRRFRRNKGTTTSRPSGDDTTLVSSAPPGVQPDHLAGAPVTIEYSPHKDGDPDPGEVVWTWVPYQEDPTQGKDRPVVVIGRRGAHLVGIPLTTKRDANEAQVKIGAGNWDPKHRVSYARVWRLLEIDAEATRRPGAALDRGRFDKLTAAIDKYYDVRIVRKASNHAESDARSTRRT